MDFRKVVYAPKMQDMLDAALMTMGDGIAAARSAAIEAHAALWAAPKVPVEAWEASRP